MAILCICNKFNEKVISDTVQLHAAQLPEKPDADDMYRLYVDVFKSCGLTYQQRDDAKPKCTVCFEAFVELTIGKVLAQKFTPSLLADLNGEIQAKRVTRDIRMQARKMRAA